MIYFYCDASTEIGLGHLNRCILIAKYLQDVLGQSITFIETSTTVKTNLKMVGIKKTILLEELLPDQVIILDIVHEKNILKPEKCCMLMNHLHQLRCEIIFIDGVGKYRFNPKLNPVPRIELIITPYIGAKDPPYLPCKQWLEGNQYVLVEPDLSNIKTSFSPVIKNVLITMGGGDRCAITYRVLCAIQYYHHINFNIIIGHLFSNTLRTDIKNLAKKYVNIKLVDSPHSLLPYYQQADLVMCTTGVTSYEVLVTGLPSIQISSIKKHVDHFSQIEFIKKIYYLGYYKEVSMKKIQKSFDELISTNNDYVNMTNQIERITDGLGVKRLGAIIQQKVNIEWG